MCFTQKAHLSRRDLPYICLVFCLFIYGICSVHVVRCNFLEMSDWYIYALQVCMFSGFICKEIDLW